MKFVTVPPVARASFGMRLALAVFATACLAGTALAHPRFVTSFLAYPSGLGNSAVVVADVNGDMHPDVITATDGEIQLRLGVGDGSLEPMTTLAHARGQFLLAVDLDSDGATDLATQSDSLWIGVLRGHGDGSFDALVRVPCAMAPVRAVAGRFDAGTTLDILTLSTRSNTLSLFRGIGDGTFLPRLDIPVAAAPSALASADLDGDGDLDAAVTHRFSNTLSVLAGDGAGGFTLIGTTPTIDDPADLVAAPMNGDSWPDLAVVSYSVAQLAIHVATGPVSYATPAMQALPVPAFNLQKVDLDQDQVVDLVCNAYADDAVATLVGRGDGTFDAPRTFSAPRAPAVVAVGDLNGGGKPDVVVASVLGTLAVLPGNGDGTLGGLREQPVGLWPVAIASGDFDEDGEPDLVTADTGDNTLSVLLGEGGGEFAARSTVAAGIMPHGLAAADVNLDSHLDLVVANSGPGTQVASDVSVLLGDGAGGFSPRVNYGVGRWPHGVAVGLLDDDMWPDLAVALGDSPTTLSVLYGQGGGAFGARQDFALGSGGEAVAIGDVTGDGHADIVLAAYYSRSVHVLPGLGNRTYWPQQSLATPNGPVSVAIAELTGDALPDIVVGNAAVSVFPAVPGGVFDPRVDTSAGGGALAVADFDLDGSADVVTANGSNSNTLSLLLHQVGGGLGGRVDLGAGSNPRSVTMADFDHDGLMDLGVANEQAGTVSVLLNTGGDPWIRWTGAPGGAGPRTALALRARPNPASGPLTVDFTLPSAGSATVRVYDVTGRRLATLAEGHYPAGTHAGRWDRRVSGGPVAQGVCFVELRSGDARVVKRVVLLR